MAAFSAACICASSCWYSGEALICRSTSASPSLALSRYFAYSFSNFAW